LIKKRGWSASHVLNSSLNFIARFRSGRQRSSKFHSGYKDDPNMNRQDYNHHNLDNREMTKHLLPLF
jgi:hypothetical protein